MSESLRITDLLALSHVPRWSIVPRLKEQTVADHTFRVIVIALELNTRLGLLPERCLNIGDMVLAILYHDVSECKTGDVPTPAKIAMGYDPDQLKHCKWLEGLDPYESLPEALRMIISIADQLEAFTWLERWGTGRHSVKVEVALRHKILELTPVDWRRVVNSLIDDITFDKGR